MPIRFIPLDTTASILKGTATVGMIDVFLWARISVVEITQINSIITRLE